MTRHVFLPLKTITAVALVPDALVLRLPVSAQGTWICEAFYAFWATRNAAEVSRMLPLLVFLKLLAGFKGSSALGLGTDVEFEDALDRELSGYTR